MPTSRPTAPRRLPIAPSRNSARGFTLLELLVCAVIIAVLSSIAYPAFSATLANTRRSDALLALMRVQLLQEQFRAEHPHYGALSELGLGSTSLSRHYAIAVLDASADGYVAHATAVGNQRQDTRCQHLSVTVQGLNVVYASGTTEAHDNTAAANSRCWKR